MLSNVRYWHLADICAPSENVRFRGYSGHQQHTLPCPLLMRWTAPHSASKCHKVTVTDGSH